MSISRADIAVYHTRQGASWFCLILPPDPTSWKKQLNALMEPPRSLKLAKKHEKFWLYDGSIVVWTEDTLFRVHQTVLSNSSEIFATLFSLPQSDDSVQDSIDGCPIVQLHDPAEDFSGLLNALYSPSCVVSFRRVCCF